MSEVVSESNLACGFFLHFGAKYRFGNQGYAENQAGVYGCVKGMLQWSELITDADVVTSKRLMTAMDAQENTVHRVHKQL